MHTEAMATRPATTTTRSKTSRRRDALLTHCIARAVVARQGGIEAAVERYGARAERISKWQATREAAKAIPQASRVCTFIVMWALTLEELDRDEISVEDYYPAANVPRATAYRHRDEYLELFPDIELNELGRIVRNAIRESGRARRPGALTNLSVALPA